MACLTAWVSLSSQCRYAEEILSAVEFISLFFPPKSSVSDTDISFSVMQSRGNELTRCQLFVRQGDDLLEPKDNNIRTIHRRHQFFQKSRVGFTAAQVGGLGAVYIPGAHEEFDLAEGAELGFPFRHLTVYEPSAQPFCERTSCSPVQSTDSRPSHAHTDSFEADHRLNLPACTSVSLDL